MTQDVVRARRFELVDHEDKVRAKLEANVTEEYEGPVSLTLFDARGEARARLVVGHDESAHFTLLDSEGRMRATLMLFDDGTPSLALFDNSKYERINLRLADLSAEPMLTMNDSNGNPRASLTVTNIESGQIGALLLHDRTLDGAYVMVSGPNPETTGGVEVRNESNELIRRL